MDDTRDVIVAQYTRTEVHEKRESYSDMLSKILSSDAYSIQRIRRGFVVLPTEMSYTGEDFYRGEQFEYNSHRIDEIRFSEGLIYGKKLAVLNIVCATANSNSEKAMQCIDAFADGKNIKFYTGPKKYYSDECDNWKFKPVSYWNRHVFESVRHGLKTGRLKDKYNIDVFAPVYFGSRTQPSPF